MEEREERVLRSFPLTTGVRASVSLRLRLGRLSLSVSVFLCASSCLAMEAFGRNRKEWNNNDARKQASKH